MTNEESPPWERFLSGKINEEKKSPRRKLGYDRDEQLGRAGRKYLSNKVKTTEPCLTLKQEHERNQK